MLSAAALALGYNVPRLNVCVSFVSKGASVFVSTVCVPLSKSPTIVDYLVELSDFS
jgi:hypothetical protein